MDCTKDYTKKWTAFLFGTAIAISGMTFYLTAEESVVTIAESITESFDGTLEPDEIPGLVSRLHGKQSESMNPNTHSETDDFESLDPGQPVFSSPRMEIPGGETTEETTGPAANSSVVATTLPERLRFNLNTNWDSVIQVQYAEPKLQNSEFSSKTGSPAGSPALSESMSALKDQLKNVMSANSKRGISMTSNTPGDLMVMALPYGAEAMVFQASGEPARKGDATKGSYIYTIGSLCWNYPCGGKTLLRSNGTKVVARLGHGYQSKPSQFLSLLAMSNILDDYEMKVDGASYRIADLVESEKAACRADANMALTLVGLSFYAHAKDQWRNDRREMWSIDKMVASELNRSIDQGTSDVTDWLLGLTSAVQLYAEDGVRFSPSIALAKKQVLTYHEFVMSIQNEQGLWHPHFFLYKGTSDDFYGTLHASGHIMRFLACSLSDKELTEPKMVEAVRSLTAKIGQVPSVANAVMLTDHQLESLAVSLQALAIYNDRVFQ